MEDQYVVVVLVPDGPMGCSPCSLPRMGRMVVPLVVRAGRADGKVLRAENANIFGFALDDDDMREFTSLNRK